MKLNGLVLRIVGGTAVIVAALGLLYTVPPLQTFLMNHEPDPDAPYFFLAFTVMTGICIACYALLAISGIHFLRGRTQLAGLFVGAVYWAQCGHE